VSPVTVHLKPREKLPSRMIIVGDPERAELIALRLLDGARLVNSNRGYLIYVGEYQGAPVGVGVHMIGGPSTAIFLEEASRLGVEKIVRIGSTGSLGGGINAGRVVVPPASIPASTGGIYAQYYPSGCPPNAHTPQLVVNLVQRLRERGVEPVVAPVVSSDAFYGENTDFARYWSSRGAVSVEMECSTLAMLGWLRGFDQACVLVVSNVLGGEGHLGTRELWPVYEKATVAVLDVLTGVGDE